jgi:hypothetical protein
MISDIYASTQRVSLSRTDIVISRSILSVRAASEGKENENVQDLAQSLREYFGEENTG